MLPSTTPESEGPPQALSKKTSRQFTMRTALWAQRILPRQQHRHAEIVLMVREVAGHRRLDLFQAIPDGAIANVEIFRWRSPWLSSWQAPSR